MKKLVFAILAFGLWGTNNAQNSGWETGVTVSAGCSINLINPAKASETYNTPFEFKPWWAYSAGVYGRKFFKESYGIEIGAQYSSFNLVQKPNGYFGEDIGYLGGNNKVMQYYSYNYVELPVRFVFKKDMGKFGIGCFAGIAPAVFTHAPSRFVQVYEGERTVIKSEIPADYMNRFNLFADVGLLVRANITSHFCLDFKPHFRATVLPRHTKTTSPDYDERFLIPGLTVSSVWKF